MDWWKFHSMVVEVGGVGSTSTGGFAEPSFFDQEYDSFARGTSDASLTTRASSAYSRSAHSHNLSRPPKASRVPSGFSIHAKGADQPLREA